MHDSWKIHSGWGNQEYGIWWRIRYLPLLTECRLKHTFYCGRRWAFSYKIPLIIYMWWWQPWLWARKPGNNRCSAYCLQLLQKCKFMTDHVSGNILSWSQVMGVWNFKNFPDSDLVISSVKVTANRGRLSTSWSWQWVTGMCWTVKMKTKLEVLLPHQVYCGKSFTEKIQVCSILPATSCSCWR